jgi:hypothetical protein
VAFVRKSKTAHQQILSVTEELSGEHRVGFRGAPCGCIRVFFV